MIDRNRAVAGLETDARGRRLAAPCSVVSVYLLCHGVYNRLDLQLLRALCVMPVFGTGVYLELSHHRATETVLG